MAGQMATLDLWRFLAAFSLFLLCPNSSAETYDVLSIGPNGISSLSVTSGQSRYHVDALLPNQGQKLGFHEGSSNSLNLTGVYSISSSLSAAVSLPWNFSIRDSAQWRDTVTTTEGARSQSYSVGVLAAIYRPVERDGFRLSGSVFTSNAIPARSQSYRLAVQPQYWFEQGFLLAADLGLNHSERARSAPFASFLLVRKVSQNITLAPRFGVSFMPEINDYSSYRRYSFDFLASYELSGRWYVFGSWGQSRGTPQTSYVYIENFTNYRSKQLSLGVRHNF
jgi:hypothetical protein